MQINRLFGIVYALLDKKKATAAELANRFEVSVRTIYRDIDALCAAGIPLYATQGKGGGIALLDDFILDRSVLSENEQNGILIALQGLTAAEYPDIHVVLSKISSLFKKDHCNWIEVDFSRWGNNRNEKEKFSTLQKAIMNNQVIAFEYFGSDGVKSDRRIDPLKLIFKAKSWYVHGFCLTRNAYRTFRVSRMFHVQITGEQCNIELPAEVIDPVEFKPERLIDLQLRFSPKAAYRLYDEFDEKDIARNEDGSFAVTASLPEGDWIYGYILSFGTEIAVLEPQRVREITMGKLEQMIQNFKRAAIA